MGGCGEEREVGREKGESEERRGMGFSLMSWEWGVVLSVTCWDRLF
jgi:hypothetical protein